MIVADRGLGDEGADPDVGAAQGFEGDAGLDVADGSGRTGVAGEDHQLWLVAAAGIGQLLHAAPSLGVG